ncbi:MAG: MBL fold metallo-hydrolase [Pseudomonadota bacterium]
MDEKHRHTRRSILGNTLRLAGLTAGGAVARAFAQQTPATRPPASQGQGAAAPNMTGTQVVLLGTKAGPGVDLKRAQTSTAIIVDGTPYLVDCGYGTVRNLVAGNINALKIEKIVFTHLHNDHTTDAPALLSLQWTGGRTTPIDLYGPYGTASMVRAIVEYCRLDSEIRTVDEGRPVKLESLYTGHDVEATSKRVDVFKDERVTVTAIENTHYPQYSRSKMPHRSIGVRFDTKTRSVVVSGDTTYSKNLVELARDADVFVCEIMDQVTRDRWLEQLKQDPQLRDKASLTRHVAETHSTPEDVGRMASEARVKLLVLSHLLTGAGTTSPLSTLIDGVRKFYQGEVVLGEDLMMI